MPLESIIFDCDGTLVDTEPLNKIAMSRVLLAQGLPQFTEEYVKAAFVGGEFHSILAQISKETGHQFPPDMAERRTKLIRDLAAEHFRKVSGADALVLFAQSRWKICVASNGQRANVLDSLTWSGLKRYFPEHLILTAQDVERPKPAPDLFLHAAKVMGVAPENCLVIEDSPTGVQAGVAAGMLVYGCTQTSRAADVLSADLMQNGAAQIFKSLSDLQVSLENSPAAALG